MTDEPFDDAFADDPAAAEREQRRREREARRAKREAKEVGKETAVVPPPEPVAPKSPKPPKPPKAKQLRGPRSPHRRIGLTVSLTAILLGFTMIAAFAYRHFNRETPPPVVVRTITLTIPEGYTRAQTAELVRDEGLRGNYEQASVSSPYLDPAKYGAKDAKSLEGFLFPDTFELEKRASVSSLVQLQLEDFRRRIKGVDMGYARSKNLTTYDVITIASLVEEEAQLESERPLVAAVIYNRLRDGMPLGIDATVRFATGNYTQPLTESELEVDSPYNTRLNAGLPPGPIGSPGLASIEAAARPAKVDYLFYVVEPGSCGEHAFSATEAEFQQDVESYNLAREAAAGNSPDTCEE